METNQTKVVSILPYIRENVKNQNLETKIAYDQTGAPKYVFAAEEAIAFNHPQDKSKKEIVDVGDIIIMDYENVAKVTSSQLIKFTEEYYVPENKSAKVA